MKDLPLTVISFFVSGNTQLLDVKQANNLIRTTLHRTTGKMCSTIAVLLFAIYIYEYVAKGLSAFCPFIYQSRYICEVKTDAVAIVSSRYINKPRATSVRCSGCVKTTSYFRRSVSPAMRRYLFEKRRDGHFVVIPDCDSESQYGLAFIGTWNKGSCANSRSLSANSISLS